MADSLKQYLEIEEAISELQEDIESARSEMDVIWYQLTDEERAYLNGR